MKQKDLEQLQEIFGEDRVFVIDEKIQISRLPKLNELLPEDEKEIEDEKRCAFEAWDDERRYQWSQ